MLFRSDFIDIAIQTSEPDSYQRSDALRRMADYLNDTETSFEEIETLCREHWDDFKMREWLAHKFIQREEWQKAIVIYEDLIESDLVYPSSVTCYREELLRLYRKTGNTEKALGTLWDLVCKSKSHEYYNELKSQYTEQEWIREREKVFPCFIN